MALLNANLCMKSAWFATTFFYVHIFTVLWKSCREVSLCINIKVKFFISTMRKTFVKQSAYLENNFLPKRICIPSSPPGTEKAGWGEGLSSKKMSIFTRNLWMKWYNIHIHCNIKDGLFAYCNYVQCATKLFQPKSSLEMQRNFFAWKSTPRGFSCTGSLDQVIHFFPIFCCTIELKSPINCT